MKKLISLTMILALLLALCACGGTTPAADTNGTEATQNASAGSLLAGYARVNITPEESVPLGGYANPQERMSTGFADYLYATICALTDETGNTAILIGIDLTSSYKTVSHEIRELISNEYDIPEENILYSASHMHSGPDLNSTDIPSIPKYILKLKELVVEGVGEALEDRKSATMYINSAETEGLNFVRRYVMNDGTYAGDNYGSFASGIKEHESDADGELQMIKFVREGGDDIVMANFQTHPHRGGSATNTTMTADLVGAFRTHLEKELGVNVLYFSGASGNINPTSRIDSENITSNYTEQGQALAQYVIDAYDSFTQVNTGNIKVLAEASTFDVNHTEDHLVTVASDLYSRYQSGAISSAELKAEGAEYGIQSAFHASSIVSKSKLGATLDFDHFTISIGDVSFVGAPMEMFDTNGMYIKDNTPYKMTFILTYCNGTNSYIPSDLGFEHGGYEVNKCKFVRGTGEAIATKFVDMLNTLHTGE